MAAHIVSVATAQTAKDECREDRETAKEQECSVQAADYLERLRMGRCRKKEGGGEAGNGNTETDGHLLGRAGD